MLKLFLYNYFNLNLQKIYTENINKFGLNHNGVFWNSKESQYNRFEILLHLINIYSQNKSINIADIGCGYAEFLNFLKKKKIFKLKYFGYDINTELINYCKKKYPETYFAVSNSPVQYCDLSVMSGTYNYSVTKNIRIWEEYIFHNLVSCFKNSKLGVIFNLQYASQTQIINNIFYVNAEKMEEKLTKYFKRVLIFFDQKAKNDVFFVLLKI